MAEYLLTTSFAAGMTSPATNEFSLSAAKNHCTIGGNAAGKTQDVNIM